VQAILIAYGTTDGHTARIAAFMGTVLEGAGAQVDIIQVGRGRADPSPERYDAVVVAGSLHEDPKVWVDLDAKINLFLKETGWQSSVVKIVAGALLYTHYGWLKRWIMHRITRKAGVETDPTLDYIYTDWDDLRLFAEGFLRRPAVRAATMASSNGAGSKRTGSVQGSPVSRLAASQAARAAASSRS
jgi:menaquinone-dependent protoporphyrinogen oxidase